MCFMARGSARGRGVGLPGKRAPATLALPGQPPRLSASESPTLPLLARSLLLPPFLPPRPGQLRRRAVRWSAQVSSEVACRRASVSRRTPAALHLCCLASVYTKPGSPDQSAPPPPQPRPPEPRAPLRNRKHFQNSWAASRLPRLSASSLPPPPPALLP